MGTGMRIQTTLSPAAVSPKPAVSSQAIQSPGFLPGNHDRFDLSLLKQPKLDAGAQAALAKLDLLPGKLSGAQLAKAIWAAIRDLDGHGASTELTTIEAWGARNAARLDPQAHAVLNDYLRVAKAARSSGSSGLEAGTVAQLRSQLAADAKVGQTRPTTKSGDVAAALANPNSIFKRQGYSAKFNPRPDELHDGKVVRSYSNGNCGPTSLAMAVKAFGLEEARVRGNPEDSIDLARNAMTLKSDPRNPRAWDTIQEPASNDVGTVQAQMIRGAKRLGLQVQSLPINHQNPLGALDAAFARGQMVLLSGQPGQPGSGHTAYENAMRTRSGDTGYEYDKGHSILVMGKDATGRYLVMDPLSRNGVVHMTAAELGTFEQWHAEAVSR